MTLRQLALAVIFIVAFFLDITAARADDFIPGPYRTLTEVVLRAEPKDDAETITTLRQGLRVNAAEAVGEDWFKIVSKHDKPPGYLKKAEVEPVVASEPVAVRIKSEPIGTFSDGNVEVLLQEFIRPNGPGSWVRDAKFYEAVFRITNISGKTVSLVSIALVDDGGVYVPQGVALALLQSTPSVIDVSGRAQAIIGDSTKPVGGGVSAPDLLQTMYFGPSPLSLAGLLAPLAITAIRGIQQGRAANSPVVQEAIRIEREYKERREVKNVTLAAGGNIEGSAFFPVTYSLINEIRFQYRVGFSWQEQSELIVPLQ